MKPDSQIAPAGYAKLLTKLKERLHASQLRATLAANRELIAFYWETGRSVVEHQRKHRGAIK